MEQIGQIEGYQSAWLLAERELAIRQFLGLPTSGWWPVGEAPVNEDVRPPATEDPEPEPLPSIPED